jgi:hypothetical protein
MRLTIKPLAMIALCALGFWSQPLLACRGVFAESYVMNAKPPVAIPAGAIPAGAIVLEVRLKREPDPFARFWQMKPIRATVLRVVHSHYRARHIDLLLQSMTSCDQLASMETDRRAVQGFVVGRLRKTPSGGVVLNPITQRATPPSP